MEATKVQIYLEKEEKKNKLVTRVKTIRLFKEETTYIFPENQQDQEKHVELFELSSIKNCSKSMIKKGQFRNITLTLPAEIVPVYFDQDMNFVFNEIYLEENVDKTPKVNSSHVDNREELLELFKTMILNLNNKETSISQIEKLFALEKFNEKKNAIQWIDCFEKECERHHVRCNERKIQTLRFFLEDNAIDWYSSTLIKLSINGDWTAWRESFLQVYADNGSIKDYVLKKERNKDNLIQEEKKNEIIEENSAESNENTRDQLLIDDHPMDTTKNNEDSEKLKINSEVYNKHPNETNINPLEKLKDQETETLPAKKKRSRSKKKHLLIKEEINIKSEQNSDSIETNINPSEKLKLEVQDKETDSQVNEVKIESGEGETKKLEIKSNTSTKEKQKKKKKKIAGIPSEENNKMKKNQTKKLKFNSKKKLFGKLDPFRSNSYKILRGISNRICEVDNGCRRSDSKLYHISKLLPYDMEPD